MYMNKKGCTNKKKNDNDWEEKVDLIYSETCVKGHSKKDKTMILMTNGSLMKVESIAECSLWSILQYFRPALNLQYF